jgi:hypothetical protein
MSITLKIVYKYRPTTYKQTHKRRMWQQYIRFSKDASMVSLAEIGYSNIQGTFIFDVAREDYVEGLGFNFGGWMVAYVTFVDAFWTDQRIIRLQQLILKNNKKILLTQLKPNNRTGTIPPCETPSTAPTDLPAAMSPTC